MFVGDLPVATPLDQPDSQSEIERTGCRAIAMHFAHHETYAVACADLQTAWRECDRTTPACEEEVPSFVVLGYAANGVWKANPIFVHKLPSRAFTKSFSLTPFVKTLVTILFPTRCVSVTVFEVVAFALDFPLPEY